VRNTIGTEFELRITNFILYERKIILRCSSFSFIRDIKIGCITFYELKREAEAANRITGLLFCQTVPKEKRNRP